MRELMMASLPHASETQYARNNYPIRRGTRDESASHYSGIGIAVDNLAQPTDTLMPAAYFSFP